MHISALLLSEPASDVLLAPFLTSVHGQVSSSRWADAVILEVNNHTESVSGT